MRNELCDYGISQVSAGSRTNPNNLTWEEQSGSQFTLGDHRTLDQVISSMADGGYIPSFCTGCYRKGRVGQDFMDLAKPGLIKQYCMPNALFTFKEYLEDFASSETKAKGFKLIKELVGEVENNTLQTKISKNLVSIQEGQRDIYF